MILAPSRNTRAKEFRMTIRARMILIASAALMFVASAENAAATYKKCEDSKRECDRRCEFAGRVGTFGSQGVSNCKSRCRTEYSTCEGRCLNYGGCTKSSGTREQPKNPIPPRPDNTNVGPRPGVADPKTGAPPRGPAPFRAPRGGEASQPRPTAPLR